MLTRLVTVAEFFQQVVDAKAPGLKGAFFHKPEGGGKDLLLDHEVDVIHDERGGIAGAEAEEGRTPPPSNLR